MRGQKRPHCTLERRDSAILDGFRRLHDWCERDEITATCLEPFDAELVAWCRAVLDEVESTEDYTLEELEEAAPHVWGQLKSEADEDNETPEAYLSGSENGLAEFLADLCRWCRRQLEAAEKRPQLLEFVEQLRQRGLVLPAAQLDVMARYQTTLDNQLYKALRAYREAQEWRLKTLEHADDGHIASAIAKPLELGSFGRNAFRKSDGQISQLISGKTGQEKFHGRCRIRDVAPAMVFSSTSARTSSELTLPSCGSETR